MYVLNAGWDTMLKRLTMSRHRPRPAAAGPLVSFSPKRQKKLGWKLFICGRSR